MEYDNSNKKIILILIPIPILILILISILILAIVSINLTILRISIKQLVIFTTFKPYIQRYLQRIKKKLYCHNKKKKPT